MGFELPEFFMNPMAAMVVAVKEIMENSDNNHSSTPLPPITTRKRFDHYHPVSKLFNPDDIKKYQKDRLITVRYHPQHEGLRILNYTPKAQYENKWDEVTENCRGLVIDGDNKIVARPFQKFHNIEDYKDLSFLASMKCVSVQDKLDGSLGILVCYKDDIFITTRGSFISEQAKRATEILHDKHSLFIDRLTDNSIHSHSPISTTYMFEIVYPGNKIIVDYRGLEDIILLGGVSVFSGWAVLADKMTLWDGMVAQEFLDAPIANVDKAWGSILNLREDNKNVEGYVLTFDSRSTAPDLRIKIKYPEYKKIAALLSNLTERKIWECLVKQEPLLEILKDVPNKYHAWAKKVQDRLLDEFDEIDKYHYELFKQIKAKLGDDAPRKEYAEEFQKMTKHTAILFAMLDGNDYSPHIFKLIMPEGNKTLEDEYGEDEI